MVKLHLPEEPKAAREQPALPAPQQQPPAPSLFQQPHAPSSAGQPPVEEEQAGAQQEEANAPENGGEAESEEDEDLNIELDEPDAFDKEGSEDDEFEVTLDEGLGDASTSGQPAGDARPAVQQAANRYVRPGADTAQRQPSSSVGVGHQPSDQPGGSIVQQASTGLQATPGKPAVWPHTPYRYVPPGGIGQDEAVLPSQAAPGQRTKLPGQTRVMPDEYKEFLGLGHGEIFNLDPDMVVDASWRHPGADMSAFFNYDLNMRTWREYCKRVEQYRLQFTMQKKIQTLDSSSREDPTIDPDLPPELRAALAAERREKQQQQHHNGPSRPFSAHGGPRGPKPVPPPRAHSDAVVLSGEAPDAPTNGRLQGPHPPRSSGHPGGQGLKVRLSSAGSAGGTTGVKVKQEVKKETLPHVNGPRPPPGRPPPRPPPVPPPRPPAGPPRGRPPPPRPPPPGPMFDGPGPMMPMGRPGGMGMPPFGPMGMGPMGPMGMGHMGMGPMGMGPMGPLRMGVPSGPGPMMMDAGPFTGGPMMMGGRPGAPPMPPMMMDDMMPGNGWPRMRGDSLAELGITEEEFEEYASKKPRRSADDGVSELGVSSFAMGMDVDPSLAPKQQPGSKPHTNGSSFVELAGYRGGRRDDGGSDSDLDKGMTRDRYRDSGRERDRDRHRSGRRREGSRDRSRSRSRERDGKRSRHHDDARGDTNRRRWS